MPEDCGPWRGRRTMAATGRPDPDGSDRSKEVEILLTTNTEKYIYQPGGRSSSSTNRPRSIPFGKKGSDPPGCPPIVDEIQRIEPEQIASV